MSTVGIDSKAACDWSRPATKGEVTTHQPITQLVEASTDIGCRHIPFSHKTTTDYGEVSKQPM